MNEYLKIALVALVVIILVNKFLKPMMPAVFGNLDDEGYFEEE